MVEKYFCDLCGKETDGIIEHFDEPVDFYLIFPEYDDEGNEKVSPIKKTIQDLCDKCHRVMFDFIEAKRGEK